MICLISSLIDLLHKLKISWRDQTFACDIACYIQNTFSLTHTSAPKPLKVELEEDEFEIAVGKKKVIVFLVLRRVVPRDLLSLGINWIYRDHFVEFAVPEKRN
ncbi:hypothetical protein SOVF_061490 [Spinacia oleracea]|nr:hypothetical protein SOVF_061490 [Spinacia oleracea]